MMTPIAPYSVLLARFWKSVECASRRLDLEATKSGIVPHNDNFARHIDSHLVKQAKIFETTKVWLDEFSGDLPFAEYPWNVGSSSDVALDASSGMTSSHSSASYSTESLLSRARRRDKGWSS